MKTVTENLSKMTLTHEVDKVAEEVSLELGGLGGYLPGEEVLLKVGGQDRRFLVEGTSNELSASGGQGWVQNLHLRSPLWIESKRSPRKTQIFLTLSPAQYEEFQRAQAGHESDLQYHPWVRLGNDYGEGGWDSNEVIKILGGLGGLTIHTSLPPYWVRQFTVEPHTPFLEAIMGLVAPLEPFFYSVGGNIFITERGAMEEELGGANRLSLSGVRMVRQEVQRKEKPSQIRLVGNLGRFRPERFKGPPQADSQPFQEVWEAAGTHAIKNYSYGIQRESFSTESGGVPFQDVPRVFALGMGITADPDSGIISDFSMEEVSVLRGRDIFGNPSSMISETRSTYRHRVFAPGLVRPVLYARAKTVIQYENTHHSFAAPRELGSVVGQPTGLPIPGRISSLDLSVFYPAGGWIVYDLYPNIEETLTYYWYAPSGELVAQNTTTLGMVYTEDGLSFKELKFMDKDELSPWGSLRRVVVRQETISYYQISRDSYGVRREVVSLNTQGRYTASADVQIVQSGAVQGSPVEPRRMQTYAESGAYQPGSPPEADLMATPAREVSINTPSWESLEALLPQFQKRFAKDEVLRVYEVLGELNIHPGLQVELQAVSNLDGTETIPVPSLDPDFAPIVVGYEIEKDLVVGRAITRLFVRGRLSSA
ncbi:MAG TPA: hypothetical protein ACFYD1_05190 [Candidatus Hypogeohydataceae bacterium YC38]